MRWGPLKLCFRSVNEEDLDESFERLVDLLLLEQLEYLLLISIA